MQDDRGLRSRLRLTSSLAIVGLIYVASLVGYWWVSSSYPPPPAFDPTPAAEPVVSIDLGTLHTASNELEIGVLLIPPERLEDPRLGVLNTDIAVRLYPWVDAGELKFPRGQTPASIDATIEAHGDADRWPFDTYTTEPITADVLVGSGDDRTVLPAEVRVSGQIEGWNVEVRQTDDDPSATVVKLSRQRGTLAFDLGVCLVLVALPAMALVVAVETIRGKRQFLPPLCTWFAAMLFAVVPLRNILPGAPPPGAWIDQAVVLWVLIALVSAMGIYITAWYKFYKQ
ncbi:DUF4436 domain-containing protein [Mycolicibacterium sp. BiH015]|uniref:DUF4436 domain-containing protein n=1 Tax=Mycolicibacterium sp. BiH015 TaxID=3018808 RepID=UPI0022DEF1F8|nr:DUF4436 domain-containing protein [Mycolicibacterium sp. BiH015]MDA2892642.1 DUF4436 domain-containing protein [Mycolicibacterium sp. BiH015]